MPCDLTEPPVAQEVIQESNSTTYEPDNDAYERPKLEKSK
jgi:hypothetical protein